MRSAFFIHIPRTAGNTVWKMYEKELYRFSHRPAYRVRRWLRPEWDSLWSFSIIRNPWERVVSLYYLDNPDVNEELDYQITDLNCRWLDWRRDWLADRRAEKMLLDPDSHELLVQDVFKFEELHNVLPAISERLGVERETLHLKAGAKKQYTAKQLLTPTTLGFIERLGSWEIDTFGYKLGESNG